MLRLRPKYCLATITDTNFVPGTLTLIQSFYRHNPWFSGDIVVFNRGLENREARYFRRFKNVRLETVSPEIVDRTDRLCEVDEQFRHRRAQFYSLDIFRLPAYDKLLFLDSDIHIRGSFKPVFKAKEGLQTVGDNFYYRDLFRNADDFSLYEPEKGAASGQLWDKTFSAGMMMFDGDMYNAQVYQDVVNMIDVNHFGQMSSNHSDQLILNQYFRDRYELVSASYNWRFNTANEIFEKDGVKMERAAAIHYTAKKKPWNPIHTMKSTKAIGERYLEAYRWWQEDWANVLMTISKMATKGGRQKPFRNLA